LAINKEKKDEMLAGYNELLGKSQAVIITQYGGLKMPELDKVRGQIRGAQAEFHITKNTLVKRALKDAGMDVPAEWLVGTTAISFCFNDPAAVAKAIGDLAKQYDKLKVVGGVVSGKAINKTQIEALASLPPLDTLRAQLIGMISAPATGIAGVLNSAVGSVMFALQAKIDKETPAEQPA
jgi:large subunit ribosomal protein L10